MTVNENVNKRIGMVYKEEGMSCRNGERQHIEVVWTHGENEFTRNTLYR